MEAGATFQVPSGILTPPRSESSGCRDSVYSDFSVNNTSPPSSPSPARSTIRRDRASSTQKEANRSKQFTTRLNRSASATSTDSTGELSTGRRRRGQFQHRNIASLPIDHGTRLVEPPHEKALTSMAFAEQQKWITVQQKTFTKWYEGNGSNCREGHSD